MPGNEKPSVLWAAAKVNLFLKVCERRADGYHDIETVFQSVGLADRLTFETAASGLVLECDDPELPLDSRNLVIRAVELLKRHFPGRLRGLRITLRKRVPMGGGLGGGSADAAATLRACNDLFELGLDAEALRRLGAELGMDVPFLIEGGRAVGTARGERLAALKMGEEVWVVIVVPRLSVSTRWAYEALDRAPARESPSIEEFVRRLQSSTVDNWSHHCYNAFERVVFPAHPELEEIRDRLLRLGCAGALLTGSGAGVIGLTGDRESAERVGSQMNGRHQLAAVVPFLASGTRWGAAVDQDFA